MRSRSRGLQSKKYIKKRRYRLAGRAFLWIISIAIVVTGLFYFFRADFMIIHNVVTSGETSVDKNKIVEIAKSELAGYYLFGLIPKTNIFFYPRATIEHSVSENIPKLDAVQAARQGDTLTVVVSDRAPVAVACLRGTDQNCFFLDDKSFVFAPATQLSVKLYIIFSKSGFPTASSTPIAGQAYTDSQQFGLIMDLASKFKKIDLSVDAVNLNFDGDITMTTDTGTEILIRRADSYDAVFENLGLFLEKSRQTAKVKKTNDVFTQIDLRYDNLIYSKSASSTDSSTLPK